MLAACKILMGDKIRIEAILSGVEEAGGLANLYFFTIPHEVLWESKCLPITDHKRCAALGIQSGRPDLKA